LHECAAAARCAEIDAASKTKRKGFRIITVLQADAAALGLLWREYAARGPRRTSRDREYERANPHDQGRNDMLETRWRTALVITGFALLGGAAMRGALAQAPAAAPQADVAELKAEIDALRSMLPSQSHSMVDVEFQYANLWFA